MLKADGGIKKIYKINFLELAVVGLQTLHFLDNYMKIQN